MKTIEQAAKKESPKFNSLQLMAAVPKWVISIDIWEQVVNKLTKRGTELTTMGGCCAVYRIYSDRANKC